MALLRAVGGFVRRDVPGPARGGCLAEKCSVGLSSGKRAGGLCGLSAQNDLAGASRHFLSAQSPVPAGSGGGGGGIACNFLAGLAGAALSPVLSRRLAVVFGNARAGDRPGAGRWRGAGRPLLLFSEHRHFSGGGAGPSRRRGTIDRKS